VAEYLGRQAQLHHRDENGQPDLYKALEAFQQAGEDDARGEWDDRLPRLEEKIGRPLLEKEREQLWERSDEHATPAEAWEELHGDKDPLTTSDFIDARLAEGEKQEEPEAASTTPLKPGEAGDLINDRLNEIEAANDAGESDASPADPIDQKLGDE
jgi:hypothetical protein